MVCLGDIPHGIDIKPVVFYGGDVPIVCVCVCELTATFQNSHTKIETFVSVPPSLANDGIACMVHR